MLKIFCWKEDEKLPDGTRLPYPIAVICPAGYSQLGHLTTLSPYANSKQELDCYVDARIRELEKERKKAHQWFDKQGRR